MNELSPEALAIALHALKDETNKAFPHNYYPTRTEGDPITQTEWDTLQYNPISTERATELGISNPNDTRNFILPKPTWAEIITREKEVALKYRRIEITPKLREHCQNLIVQAYNAKDPTHELQIRLDNRQPTNADSKRTALRTRYRDIKTFIDTTTNRTLLESFNPTADKHWDLTTTFSPTTET